MSGKIPDNMNSGTLSHARLRVTKRNIASGLLLWHSLLTCLLLKTIAVCDKISTFFYYCQSCLIFSVFAMSIIRIQEFAIGDMNKDKKRFFQSCFFIVKARIFRLCILASSYFYKNYSKNLQLIYQNVGKTLDNYNYFDYYMNVFINDLFLIYLIKIF